MTHSGMKYLFYLIECLKENITAYIYNNVCV